VVGQAPIGISITPAGEGNSATINAQMTALLGHGIRGTGFQRYVSYGALHDDGTSYEPADYPTVRALTKGERVDRELMRYRVGPDGGHAEGEVRRLEVTSGPVRNADDAIVAAVTLATDVEEGLRAAEYLADLEGDRRRTQADLALALDAGKLGTFSVSLPDRVLATSEQFRANFGRDPGKPFTYADKMAAVHPDDRADMERAVDRSISFRLAPHVQERSAECRGMLAAQERDVIVVVEQRLLRSPDDEHRLVRFQHDAHQCA
jgi:hypothetical protein